MRVTNSLRHLAFLVVPLALLIAVGPEGWDRNPAPAGVNRPPASESRGCGNSDTHNCRFWGSVADGIPALIITDHLVTLPYSIKHLSVVNPNGWSVAHFPSMTSEPVIRRGQPPAYLDSLFDAAAIEAANASPTVAVSHVRKCSSGLCEIPNPHPFEREKNDRPWLMAHNGSIDVGILLDLIDPDYLLANPPQYGADSTDWIDSELYFIYMLQTFEAAEWQIKPALGLVIETLREAIPDTNEALNFILTDGSAIWAYREGRTLYYTHEDVGATYSAVASRYPSTLQEDWVEVIDGELVTMRADAPPLVEDIEDYFGLVSLERPGSAARPAMPIDLESSPNPFGPAASIRFVLPEATPVTLRIFDVAGRSVRVLADAELRHAGPHLFRWDGTDASGREMGSGIYWCRLRAGRQAVTKRLVLLQ